MPKASVKRLIECEKKDLIELVLDIEKYPEFVPFCFDAKIYENKKDGDLQKIIADLTIGKGPFKDTYKSDVSFGAVSIFFLFGRAATHRLSQSSFAPPIISHSSFLLKSLSLYC